MSQKPFAPKATEKMSGHDASIMVLAIVTGIMTVTCLSTGRGNMLLLVGVSFALFALAAGNFFALVRRSYKACLDGKLDAVSGYERMHYRNGLRGVGRPASSAFFALAAWRAGKDTAARSRNGNGGTTV